MQATYPLKIQAIRSKNQQARLYVYFPLPLAAAIGLKAGEEVQWELLDRGELHLVREQVPSTLAAQRATKPAQASTLPEKQAAKGHHSLEVPKVVPEQRVSDNNTRRSRRFMQYSG